LTLCSLRSTLVEFHLTRWDVDGTETGLVSQASVTDKTRTIHTQIFAMHASSAPTPTRRLPDAILALILITITPAVSPAEKLPVRTYTATDGLGSSFVAHIMQDSAGYLWFSTRDGLSRYNGYEFITYSRSDGLPVSIVSACVQVKNGDYLVLTNDGGVSRFSAPSPASRSEEQPKPAFTRVRVRSGSGEVVFHRLYVGPTGILWGGSNDRIIRGVGTTNLDIPLCRESERRNNPLSVTGLAEDRNGVLWAGTTDGLFRLKNGTVTHHYLLTPDGSRDLIHDLMLDDTGLLWVAHDRLGVIVVYPDSSVPAHSGPHPLIFRRNGGASVKMPAAPGEAVLFAAADGLTDSNATSLLQSAGYIWIGTAKGLTRFDGKRFTGYTTANGLSTNIIHCLIEDRDGCIWIGSPAGAMCLIPNGLTSYTIDDGEASLNTSMIGETPDGSIYAFGRDWWVSLIKDRTIRSSRPLLPDGVTLMWSGQIGYLDRHQRWWALTSKGLFVQPGSNGALPSPHTPPARVFTTTDGLPSPSIFRLYEDRHGTYWIGTRPGNPQGDGIARLNADLKSIQFLHDIPGLPNGNAPTSFAEDSSGSLWIGFYGGGLVRFRDDAFRSFGAMNGIPTSPISDLMIDHAGHLWISTGQDGVFCVDNPVLEPFTVSHYTKEDGLSSDYVRRVAEDRFGRVYASTVRGVDRIDPASGNIVHLTMRDGLAADFINTDFVDSRGNLWFGTARGVSCLTPTPPMQSPPPPIVIIGIRIAGEAYPVHELGQQSVEGIQLEPDQRELTIGFSSIAIHTAHEVRYQYTINGEHGEWSRPSPDRSVNFARLAPGNYAFRVRALSPDGIASSQPAAVSFVIRPPLWLRWWFQLGAVVLVAVILLLLYRWRIRRMKEIERMRLLIASDLHDEIATNLSSIAMFSTLISNKSADPAILLERITALSTESVNIIRDIIWSIDPKVETVASLLGRLRDSMIVSCRARGMQLNVVIPPTIEAMSDNLTPEQRKNLWLMLKEAVTNALKHSEATELAVEASLDGKSVRIVVADNGRGCDPSRQNRGKGVGTMNMRAGILGGKMVMKTDPGTGTIIEFSALLNR
jgi:ligand-binding sensor domain-containing protein/two-component sensor histidine kinase